MRADTSLVTVLEQQATAAGYWHPNVSGRPRDRDLFLFGLRAPSRVIGPWQDALGALRYVGGKAELYLWPGTTEPGREGTAGKLNDEGVACLVPGQYRRCWSAGTHRAGTPSAHRALVQQPGAGFRVTRDKVADGLVGRDGPTYTDVGGLNAHRAYRDGLTVVGDASHGCQVWQSKADHDELMALYDEQVAAGLGNLVSYALFDLERVPALAPLLAVVRPAS